MLCLSVAWRLRIAGFIEGVGRAKTTFFPEWLDDWIAEKHLVRVVDLFVDPLDLAALGLADTWRHAPDGHPFQRLSCLCRGGGTLHG